MHTTLPQRDFEVRCQHRFRTFRARMFMLRQHSPFERTAPDRRWEILPTYTAFCLKLPCWDVILMKQIMVAKHTLQLHRWIDALLCVGIPSLNSSQHLPEGIDSKDNRELIPADKSMRKPYMDTITRHIQRSNSTCMYVWILMNSGFRKATAISRIFARLRQT